MRPSILQQYTGDDGILMESLTELETWRSLLEEGAEEQRVQEAEKALQSARSDVKVWGDLVKHYVKTKK